MRLIRGWGPVLALCVCASAQAGETRCHVKVGRVPLIAALRVIGQQCDYVWLLDNVPDVMVGPLEAQVTPTRALRRLLRGSRMEVIVTPLGVLTVRPRRRTEEPARDSGIPEVMVNGSRIFNVDIFRTRDDVRPYVIFDRTSISFSAYRTVGELLRMELGGIKRPVATRRGSVVDYFPQDALHGLPEGQTLILVNGRTVAGPTLGTPPVQPDMVEALALSAVERIEVIPASASAEYGAWAAAGVINIVLRGGHDNLLEVVGEIGHAQSAGSSLASVAYGDLFDEGRTHVLLVVSDLQEGALPINTRDGLAQGRAWLDANAPDYWRQRGAPPVGLQTNIASNENDNLSSVLGSRASVDASGGFRSGYDLGSGMSAQPGGSRALLQGGYSTSSVLAAATRKLSHERELYFEFLGTRSVSKDAASGAGYLGLDGLSFDVGAPNPFKVPVTVSVPASALDGPLMLWRTNYSGTLGLRWTSSERWHGIFEYSVSRAIVRWQQPAARSAAADALSGKLDVFQDAALLQPQLARYAYTLETSALPSQVSSLSLRGAGTLFEAAEGPAQLSGVVEHRERVYGGGYIFNDAAGGSVITPETAFSREFDRTDSLFARLEVPLYQVTPFIAARVDRVRLRVTPLVVSPRAAATPSHVVAFSSIDPVVGLSMRPVASLLLRASFATGYIPPTAAQLAPRESVLPPGTVTDSRRGDEPVGVVPIRAGGNPNLGPERTSSFTVGAVITPLPGVRFALDRTHIREARVIAGLFPLAIRDPAQLSRFGDSRVTRAAVGLEDAYGVGPITGLDATDDGSGHSDMVAWHADLSFETLEYDWGHLAWDVIADRHPRLAVQAAPDLPLTNTAGTVSAPPRQAYRSVVRYSHGAFGLSWTLSHFSAYDIPPLLLESSGLTAARVSAQTYHDVRVNWHSAANTRWPFETQVYLAVQNALNRSPPFDPQAGEVAGFYSPFGDPRLRRVNLGVVLTLR